MHIRTRKLIGTVILLVWVVFYALLVMAVMFNAARNLGPLGEPLFYALAGVGWIPVAMLVVWWMARPGAGDETA
ncbi:MAG: DUF2842 domain-containing protein [Rhizobiales bacterium]|nr:DUF2842 domain-containing protein [Hyphomicrobiales bacterium]